MLTAVAVRMESEDLARLDAIVEQDCSSRSAVLRKAIRLLSEQSPLLPGASRNQVAVRAKVAGTGADSGAME
jgi:metal-responsive CopG/Arc/MetJ family transcriptional regulator